MLQAKSYDDWIGPLSIVQIETLELGPNSLIWYKHLCPNSQDKPHLCVHEPIFYFEFRTKTQDFSRTDTIFYIKECNDSWLDFIEKHHIVKYLGILTALIMFLTALLKCTTSSPTIHNENNPNITIMPGLHSFPEPPSCYESKNNFCGERVEGVTKNDKKATFEIYYLSQEKKWKYDSHSKLTEGDLKTLIDDTLLKNPNLEQSIGIIAIGTSSQEGGKDSQEIKALNRADKLLEIMRDNKTYVEKELFRLNLGQYQNKKDGLSRQETAYQRRVIIAGILQMDEMEHKELEEALKNAVTASDGLKYKKDDYSTFDFMSVN